MAVSGNILGMETNNAATVTAAKRKTLMFQPDYTDCPNCGTADHNDYDCPCGCHGDEAPSRARQARREQGR